jgi:hypothetical protein
MSDEQTIYIGPQDDLTNVRERLERIPARRVTLVIPSQTLLRSLIAWRNLYARAQELGKEVLIISSDPQVRSVAQGAKFKVASLESGPPGNKSRPSGRILRPSPAGRGQNSPSAEVRVPPGGPGERRGSGSWRSRQSGQSPLREPRPLQPSPESRSMPTAEPTIDDVSDTQISPAGPSEQVYGPPYDAPFDASPPIRPLSREQIEEEADDLFLDDVQKSHDIVKAANEGSKGDVPSGAPQPARPASGPIPFAQEPPQPPQRISPSDESDPYAAMGDHEPPLIGEQRGSVSMDDFDTTEQRIQEIPDYTTEQINGDYGEEVHEGTHDSIVVDAHPSDHPWMDMLAEDEQDAERPANRPRAYGSRSRDSFTGKPPLQRRGDERLRDMPSIEDEPTQITPQGGPAEPPPIPIRMRASASGPASATPASSSKSSGLQSGPPVSKQAVPPRFQNKQEPLRPSSMKSGSTGGTSGSVGKRAGSKGAATQRRTVNRIVALAALLLALCLLLVTLAYAVPSATVSVTLVAKNYTKPVTLSARPQQALAPGLVPADQLTQDFMVSVTANATGSKAAAGGPKATGTVTFTNTGTKPLDIPNGTTVMTAGGISFTTTYDAAIPPPNSNVPNHTDIPVQGNVNADAGEVTVIPPDSLTAIVKSSNFIAGANVTLADAQHLQVTNAQPITGGGTQSVHAVQQADLDAAKATARTQEQSAIAAWVKQNTHTGDVAGPAVVTNTALVNAPAVDTAEDSGTFPVTIKLSATVLLVRNANVQAATVMTMNNLLKQDAVYHSSYVVFNNPKQPLTLAPGTPKGDEKALSLSFTPTVKIVPNISEESVQHLLAGKAKTDVERVLMALNPAKTIYVQRASVQTWPTFINWIPFLASRITVNFVAG